MGLGEAIGGALSAVTGAVTANAAQKNAQAQALQARDSAVQGIQARTNEYVQALQQWIAQHQNPALSGQYRPTAIPNLGDGSGAGVTSPYAAGLMELTGGHAPGIPAPTAPALGGAPAASPYQAGFAAAYRAPAAGAPGAATLRPF